MRKSLRFHLTTEELLRHFDGELIPERAVHIDRCVSCQEKMVELQALLYEVQQELRTSVPEESEEFKAASWARLQQALHPPKQVIGFPLRPAVYATAAMLAVAAFSGYLTLRAPDAEENVRIVAETPSRPLAERASLSEPLSTIQASALESERNQGESRETAAPQPDVADVVPVVEPLEEEAGLPARFEMAALAGETQVPVSEAVFIPAPLIGEAPDQAQAMVSFWQPAFPAVSEPSQPNAPETPPSPMTVEAAAALVDGYWILSRANAWREDIRPHWRAGVLSFEGTVENGRARERLTRAIQRAAGSREVRLTLQPRSQLQFVAASYSGETLKLSHDRPSGGVVRSSLLGHFSDAARRSFRTPESSVLEAELDRYVSEVFRSQSRLLSHVYALSRVFERVDAGLVKQLPQQQAKRFREMAGFHVNAIRNEEARIYDRLSEALPRRFWAYRGPRDSGGSNSRWVDESRRLLEDALELETTLIALLGDPQSTIDARQQNLSCGALLASIRTRLANLKAPLQALQ